MNLRAFAQGILLYVSRNEYLKLCTSLHHFDSV